MFWFFIYIIIYFRTYTQAELSKIAQPDAFVVMYSVIDKASFQKAEEYLALLHDLDLMRGKAAILVGNKVDLVRSRIVSSQGKQNNNINK